MEVVVVPDNRAPVVTHMVWYRVGAADEPAGVSGIAHFLEHLMFKSTDKITVGEFSKIVSRLGGQDNAFTGHDATAYFQRVAADRLDRDGDGGRPHGQPPPYREKVVTERDVILEERRSRIENNPVAPCSTSRWTPRCISTTIRHPGHRLVARDGEAFAPGRADFYKHYYAPNNAILVVTGDVTPGQVKARRSDLRQDPSQPAGVCQARASERTARSALHDVSSSKDARAGKFLHRYYQVPAYITADPARPRRSMS